MKGYSIEDLNKVKDVIKQNNKIKRYEVREMLDNIKPIEVQR